MSRPRLLALAVAVGLVVLPAGAGAEDEAGSGLDSYQLLANAPGIGLDGLYRDVAVTVPEVTSSLRTGNVGSGFASLAWPGPVVGNGGSTLLVLTPQLPPETVLLNSPVRAEARTGGEAKDADTTVPGTLMAATAEPDEATADATFNDTVLPIGTAGAMTSSSRVALEGAAQAVAESKTVAQDVSLAEGVIEIGSVVSTASAASDGVTGTAKGGTTVAGLKIAGVPVTVDGTGVTVQAQKVPNPLPVQAVNEAVQALGLQIALTDPRTVTSGGNVNYQAGALVLVFSQGGEEYALTFGRASAKIDAAKSTGDGGAVAEAPAAPAPPAAVPVSTGGDAPAAQPVSDGGGASVPEVALPDAPADAPLPAEQAPAAPPLAAPEGGGLATFVPVSFALAGGVPTLLALVGLSAAALLAAGLRRLPDRVLALPTVDCDERSTR